MGTEIRLVSVNPFGLNPSVLQLPKIYKNSEKTDEKLEVACQLVNQ